jgi:hypothetical protein
MSNLLIDRLGQPPEWTNERAGQPARAPPINDKGPHRLRSTDPLHKATLRHLDSLYGVAFGSTSSGRSKVKRSTGHVMNSPPRAPPLTTPSYGQSHHDRFVLPPNNVTSTDTFPKYFAVAPNALSVLTAFSSPVCPKKYDVIRVWGANSKCNSL